jgi:carboxymethylenebutenolidase
MLFQELQAMGTQISFARPDGKEASAYLAKSGEAGRPGIVVIQEWWGLQDQIKGICDRLALAGYEALAPDLYAGTVIPYHDSAAANREMSSLNFLECVDQVVRGAVLYLKKTGVKVGLTGFCMGGAVTTLGAARISELSAAVSFYGLAPAAAVKPTDVKVPLQIHYCGKDTFFTPKMFEDFAAGLKASGRTYEMYRYEADHGFVNEQREVHDREAADLAWGRMLAFWKTHLGA